jgi:DNA mismatch repair protein MutL
MSCIYSVFERDFALGLTEVRSENDGILVSGYITKPSASRAGRSMQHFFVNGRPIRSRTLSAALEEAFKNSITVGRYPGCVLHLGINPAHVDVNVHPAKAEVKFSNERAAFDAMYFATKNALETDSGRVNVVPSGPKPPAPVFQTAVSPPRQEFFVRMDASRYASSGGFKTSVPAQRENDLPDMLHEPGAAPFVSVQAAYNPPPPIQNTYTVFDTREKAALPDWRIVGEALGTYIIVEQGQSVLLIDKHAAHERILYERLLKSAAHPASQILITPALPALSAQEAGVLLENLDLLNTLGFEAGDFGGKSLYVRACPEGLDEADIGPALTEIAQKLIENRRAPVTEKRDLLLYTVACKAAVKAGSRMTGAEREALILEVMTNPDIKFCPHGRPIVLELTKAQLERQFKRT